jgi:hypothetical protein
MKHRILPSAFGIIASASFVITLRQPITSPAIPSSPMREPQPQVLKIISSPKSFQANDFRPTVRETMQSSPPIPVGSSTASRDLQQSSSPSKSGTVQPRPHETGGETPLSRRIDSPETTVDPASQAAILPRRSTPPAVRLSSDFKLPAAAMAVHEDTIKHGLPTQSKRVTDAGKQLVDYFYQGVIDELTEAADWQKDLVTNTDTGEETVVVKPDKQMDSIRPAVDERFLALYGAEAYNAAVMASATERMLPED